MTLKEEIKITEKELKKVYDRIGKEKAFGDAEIGKINARLNYLRDQFKGSKECQSCKGTGVTSHECNCDFCEKSGEECEVCDGEGRVW